MSSLLEHSTSSVPISFNKIIENEAQCKIPNPQLCSVIWQRAKPPTESQSAGGLSQVWVSSSYLEGTHEGFIHTHHAAGVVELPAVVGSWEQSHQLPLSKELITIFYHLGASHTHHYHRIWTSWAEPHFMHGCASYLVGSADKVQVVAVQELTDHISSKCKWDTAVILSPALDILVGVRPKQVAKKACKRNNINLISINVAHSKKIKFCCASCYIYRLSGIKMPRLPNIYIHTHTHIPHLLTLSLLQRP